MSKCNSCEFYENKECSKSIVVDNTRYFNCAWGAGDFYKPSTKDTVTFETIEKEIRSILEDCPFDIEFIKQMNRSSKWVFCLSDTRDYRENIEFCKVPVSRKNFETRMRKLRKFLGVK
jgi:dynactin complex subunit